MVVEAGEPVGDRELREPRVGLSSSCVRSWTFSSSSRFISSSAWFFADSDAISCSFSRASRNCAQQALDGEPQIGLVPRLGDVVVEARAVDRVDHRVEAGLPGQQDLGRRRAAAVDLLEQLDALHAGHDLIGDHHRERLAVARRARRSARARRRPTARRRSRTRRRSARRAAGAARVRMPSSSSTQMMCSRAASTVTRSRSLATGGPRRPRSPLAPAALDRQPHLEARAPGLRLAARSSPPCFSTIWRTMPSPSPVPSPFGLVVKNGSKIRGSTSAGIPGPSSITRTTATSRRRRAVSITISPRPPSACTALWIRFVHTWFSSST